MRRGLCSLQSSEGTEETVSELASSGLPACPWSFRLGNTKPTCSKRPSSSEDWTGCLLSPWPLLQDICFGLPQLPPPLRAPRPSPVGGRAICNLNILAGLAEGPFPGVPGAGDLTATQPDFCYQAGEL